jgi:hypothetical protein
VFACIFILCGGHAPCVAAAAATAAAGVLSLLELLQHLAAPDCEGAVLLMPSVCGAPAGSQQQQQQQGLLGAVLGLLHERHIAALQVRLPCVHLVPGQPLAWFAVSR